MLTHTSNTVLILAGFFVDTDKSTNSKTHMELQEIQNHRDNSEESQVRRCMRTLWFQAHQQPRWCALKTDIDQ